MAKDATKVPKIIHEPPGPLAKKFLKEDSQYISPSYARYYPLVVEKVEGTKVIDVDGNIYIDFNSGLLCTNLGHHKSIINKIKKQAEKLIHYSITDFYYKEVLSLAKELSKILPFKTNAKFHFGNSGTEAIETAIKLARYYTEKQYLIGFIGAFHGRTYGSLSLTASKPVHRKKFGPFLPGIIHVPYPYCYRCPFGKEFPDCDYFCVNFIKEWIFEKFLPKEEVAALVFEPVLGEGGFVWPPKDFFKKIKQITNNSNILLIDDEIQAGIGRTGKWFAIEHYDIEPDIIAIAKGIANGLPLGITAAKHEIMIWEKGAHATTFGGNPIACEVAKTVIQIIKKEKILDRVLRIGDEINKILNEMKEKYEIVGDVRGKGFMQGVELVKDKKTKKEVPEKAVKVITNCWKKGLLVITGGKSTIRIAPPLNIEEKLIIKGLEILEEEIKKVNNE